MKSSDIVKLAAAFLLGSIVGALAAMFVGVSRVENVPLSVPVAVPVVPGGAVRYNCELSGGSFEDGACVCPLESFQTQEEMYDQSTGFCQTSFGGPGGDAFAASIGLPYGHYGYWNDIMVNLCESSGGSRSGAACICPDGKTFSEETGECQSD